jgi:hypothetical protein
MLTSSRGCFGGAHNFIVIFLTNFMAFGRLVTEYASDNDPMDQKNLTRMYSAMGLALQVGCLAVVIAVGSLLVGLWLDQTTGSKRTWALVCVALGVPINLFVVLRTTQFLVARIIPPDRPTTELRPPSGEKPEASVKDDLE